MTAINKPFEALRELERGWRAFAKSTWPPEPTTSGFEWHNPVYSENEIQLLNKHADQLAALLPALEQQMNAAVAAAVNNCLRKRDVEWRKALGWNETFLMYPDDARAKLETLLREARLEEAKWWYNIESLKDADNPYPDQQRIAELSAPREKEEG
jgi:hypothetical protein